MAKNSIKDLNIYYAKSSLSKPIADATHQISKIAFYILEIVLESEVRGQGYLLSFHYSPNAISGALRDLKDYVIGYDVNETIRLSQDLAKEHEYFGENGLLKWALAIVNIAMWDAWGRTLEKPIHEILGTNSTKIPIYGSGGWLSYSNEELLDEVDDYKKRGFQAVKVKVGSPDLDRDIERLSKVREHVGPHVNIMMDANQGMSLSAAIKLSLIASERIGIHWFEEPLVHSDFAGYELLRSKTNISLAMGEREYDLEPLKALITRNAIDLWQPDILRIGGVEGWRTSALLANAHQIPVLPHYYKDYDVPLLCTIPNAYGAESFDWIDGIIDNTMHIRNGMAYPRMGAGWGFHFLEKHLIEI